MNQFHSPFFFILIFLGQPIHVPIDPSKCVLTQLKIDRDRNDLIARKQRGANLKNDAQKYTGKDVAMGVD